MSDFGYSLEPVDHDPFSDQPQPYQQQPSGEFAPYQAPSVTEAKNQLYGLTGIPDIQEARAAYSRGEYLPALGQGAVGAANLGAAVLGPIGALERLPASAAALARAAELGVPANRARELGMFAGESSKTADLSKLEQAKNLQAAGTPREEILSQTGWFQGPDSQWKYEIPDDSASLNSSGFRKGVGPGRASIKPKFNEQNDYSTTLGNLLKHPELYKAYPELQNMYVEPSSNMGGYLLGPGWSGDTSKIPDYEGMIIGAQPPDQMLKTLLHESQHSIQPREGFARGGNHATEGTVENALKLAGETEARAVEVRRTLTGEERLGTPVWKPGHLGYDVPESEQGVKFNDPEQANLSHIFAGRKSLIQPENNHGTANAETMEKMGFNPQMIFQNTGWFRGPDDQWKFPISDEAAKLKEDAFTKYKSYYPDQEGALALSYGKSLKLPDVLDHPELFQAYPHLKDVNVGPTHPLAPLEGLKGNYTYNPEGAAQIRLTPDKEQDLLSTLMHEVQHGVQYHEGFAVGGMPDEFLPPRFNEGLKIVQDRFKNLGEALRDVYGANIYTVESALAKQSRGEELLKYEQEELGKVPNGHFPRIKEALQNMRLFQQAQKDANQKYKDLGGEVESRLVQQQLAEKNWGKLPWQYEGYTPPAEQILKYYTPENKAQYVITDPNLLDTAKKYGVRALHSNGFPLGTYFERVDHTPDFGNLEVGR